MKVILTQDVDALGSAGDIVTVKPGYGRNFLVPRGLALPATKRNVKVAEENRRQASHKLSVVRENAEELGRRLADLDVIIPARVGEENRIFGSVTTQQVADALAKKGLDIDRRKIDLQEEIRALGVYPATVRLHSEVTAEIKIQVVPSDD